MTGIRARSASVAQPRVRPLDPAAARIHAVHPLLALVESGDELLEERPHGRFVPAEVAEGGAAGRLVDQRALVEQPAHREQEVVEPPVAAELNLAEGVPLQAGARDAVEPSVGGAHVGADMAVQRDAPSKQPVQRRAQDAVREDVHRQLLEFTRSPGPRTERALRRLADRQLPADAGEILPPFDVPAVDPAPEEVVDAAGEHLAEQVLHRRETVERGQPRSVAFLDPSPGVAEEVVDVEDRDVLHGPPGSGVGREPRHFLLDILRRVEPVLAKQGRDLGCDDVGVPVVRGFGTVGWDEIAVADLETGAEFAVVGDRLVELADAVGDAAGEGGVGAPAGEVLFEGRPAEVRSEGGLQGLESRRGIT